MAFPGPNMTVLSLSGIGVPPYSARGLTQTLAPIGASQQMRRTINGALRDFSGSQFQKYASTISGTDQQPPACDGVWPGKSVLVNCIAELCISGTVTDPGALGRTPVSGSIRHESGFTFYRPQLTMRVVNFSLGRREWDAEVTWSMDLEEV